MNFKLVLEKLLTAFEKDDVHYALIGGFAMGLWGSGRTTVDLDFLVSLDDMEKVDNMMKTFGYERLFHSENISQYISPLKVFGEVDFLHAFRQASLEMIENAEEKNVFNGSLKIRTIKPESLIGLKLQAIKNNPSRKQKEIIDIEFLLSGYKDKMDSDLIERYVAILEVEDIYKEILRRLEDEDI